MKDVIIKVILIAIALSAFSFFVASGLWADSKMMDSHKNTEVSRVTIPQN